MKKLVLLAIAGSFFIAGCSSKKPETEVKTAGAAACLQGAPEWVLIAPEGGMSATGSAKITKAGINHAKTIAISSARDEMARNISVRVNNMIKNFTQVTGIGDEETIDKVTAEVSKQVSNTTLPGSKQKSMWISPCDEYYALVTLDPASVQKSVKNSVSSSYKNDNALWQQFQSQKAQDELNASILSEFPRN